MRAQIVTDPARADRISEQLAERLHLGTTNDCMFNASTAACGSNGPHLGDHVCAGADCHNALYTPAHRALLEHSVARIDRFLALDRGNTALLSRVRGDRARLIGLIRELSDDDTNEGTP
jgi:hypothetical protein